MEQSFQKNRINANISVVKQPERTSIFFLSVKEVKERFSHDYAIALEEFRNKKKINPKTA